ncbi:uncharacterized protein isoform X4 [Leptinotarsa decemlineata]|uniref:uncharacterized protein isoform X4 n=1 Tax=Leptinotarsa decemlineata TaxID=7539 RepID=UPI003D305990
MAMECETTIKKEPDLFNPEEMVFEKTTVKLEPNLEMFSRNEIHDNENDATEQDYMVYKNESEGYKQETEEKYNVTEVKIPKEELIKSEDSIDIHYEFIKTEDKILEPGGHCEVCGKHFIILENSKEFYPDCSCHEQNELINIGNEDVTKDVALSSTATTSDSSAASRRILQICLNTETKPIIVPEKSNIISEDSPACSSNAEDSPISSLTLKMNSENNSSCSRDSAEDPIHLSDSNFGKNETNRRRSENYKFRIADGDENAISGTTNERDELMNEAGFSEQHKTSRTKPFKVIRQPDFCFFCKTEVKNFARHIQRNHVGETEVQNILALPSNSIERKRAFACLRKKRELHSELNNIFKAST